MWWWPSICFLACFVVLYPDILILQRYVDRVVERQNAILAWIQENGGTLQYHDNDNCYSMVYNLPNVTVHSRNRRAAKELANETLLTPTSQPRRHKFAVAKHFALDSRYAVEVEQEGDTLVAWSEVQLHRRSRQRRQQFGKYDRASGTLTITKSGWYTVYSQITYYDNSGRWCHAIKHNEAIVAKCLASEWGMALDENTNRYIPTVHSCYTSRTLFLRRRDTLRIISLYGQRNIHNSGDLSFWGVSRLGD